MDIWPAYFSLIVSLVLAFIIGTMHGGLYGYLAFISLMLLACLGQLEEIRKGGQQ